MNTKNLSFPLSHAGAFQSVSCPSTTFCVAVGTHHQLNGTQPKVAYWGTLPGGGLFGL
jgi:hypothetical protein